MKPIEIAITNYHNLVFKKSQAIRPYIRKAEKSVFVEGNNDLLDIAKKDLESFGINVKHWSIIQQFAIPGTTEILFIDFQGLLDMARRENPNA